MISFPFRNAYPVFHTYVFLVADKPPRSLSQVQNARKVAAKMQRIDGDVVDSFVAISGALPDFVQSIEFVSGA